MSDDDLTPEQQEVRRLLADARHDEPTPEPVVARLDRVLAELADEPVRVAPVTGLATRRRRAASLLLAAAAVVAIGVGVGQVVGTGTTGEDAMSADRNDPAAAAQAEDAEPEQPEKPAGDADGGANSPTDSQSNERGAQTFAQLSRDGYTDDVTALRDQAAGADMLLGIQGLQGAYNAAGATCLSDAWGEGRFVPVRYAGIPAVLVFRRAMGDTQVADLFRCGDAEPRRSVTLPAP